MSSQGPYLKKGIPISSPHMGWPTDAGFQGFAESAAENILGYLEGKLIRAVNPEALERGKKRQ